LFVGDLELADTEAAVAFLAAGEVTRDRVDLGAAQDQAVELLAAAAGAFDEVLAVDQRRRRRASSRASSS
jgi:hypothetical protein